MSNNFNRNPTNFLDRWFQILCATFAFTESGTFSRVGLLLLFIIYPWYLTNTISFAWFSSLNAIILYLKDVASVITKVAVIGLPISPYCFLIPYIEGKVPTWAHYCNHIITVIWDLVLLRNRINTIKVVTFVIFS